MCAYTPPPTEAKDFPSREKSSVQGVQMEFFGSLEGVQLGVSRGYSWKFLGASRQGVLLEILGRRRVQLDVFRSLKVLEKRTLPKSNTLWAG